MRIKTEAILADLDCSMASKRKQGILKRKLAPEAPGGMGPGDRAVSRGSKQSSSKTAGRQDVEEDSDDDQSSSENEAVEDASASADSDEEEEEEEVEEGAESDGSSDGEAGSDSGSEDGDSDTNEATQSGVQSDGRLQTEEDIKRELSTMSFEDIMALQSKVGRKMYNEVAYGAKSKAAHERKKRLNKNRPTEISAKRPAPFLRQVVHVKKSVLRDPRFDDLSGEYKPEIFEQTYGFIQDLKRKEMQVVQKRLRSVKSAKKKEQLELLLKRMVNQEKAHERQKMKREKELEMKRTHREMVGEGQRPFYLNKGDQRRLELAAKYGDLKRSGKLDNFLSKKRKRNAAKDRRKLPFQLKPQ
ncbi:hypothetical protein AAFF_G00233960 [Aldrovandia affinis]|uniref:rRNA biogenesis protein RRP36 n=1 Tax=Aldrovandia affinis TaxID=143900 RepID=A0AAD7REP2_9TELE|nr:hypothetical protein AAFF_G00233960 [Aldrovandia affinis]